MSSEKTVSDPLEPEGTGVPADAATEHTTSGSAETEAATSSDKAASKADTDTAEAGDPEATVQAGKAAAETAATEKAAESATSGADDTVVVSTAATADDVTVTIDKASAGDKATAENKETAKADSGDTVVLNKSDAAPDDAVQKVDTAKKSDDAAKKDDVAKKSDDANDSAKPAGRRSLFSLPALIGAAVLLVVLLVAVGVFFFLAGNKQEELDRRAAATKAACDFGNNFATYTGDKADDYLKRLDQSSTGEWKKLVSQIGPDLKARFAASKVTSTASGVQCGYVSGSGDNARVVLVIDQQFTTANAPQQQGPGQVKVAADVSMQKVDGTWLVADFDTPMMQQ
jgi:hypothetical protein